MNYLKILDNTLYSLKEYTEENPLPKEYVLLKVNILNRLSNRDVRLVFDKLKEDKYIDSMILNELDQYFITFNGLLFIQKGGYSKEKSNKDIVRIFKIVSSVFLLLASIFTIMYSGIEIYKFFNKSEIMKKETKCLQQININN